MTWLNGADRRSQDFSRKYPGSAIDADKIILHTTEGPNWPSYDGGKNAPHITIKVNPRTGACEWRQHYPLNRSSRALKNLPGGVETNTDDTIQVELIGTCDPRAMTGWAKDSLLWPAAEEKHLAGVRTILKAICAATDVPFVDAAPRGWKSYPSSYANGAGQRLTNREWSAARGILGHQHVPENTHGDPGNIPISRLLKATAPTPAVPKSEEDDMKNIGISTKRADGNHEYAVINPISGFVKIIANGPAPVDDARLSLWARNWNFAEPSKAGWTSHGEATYDDWIAEARAVAPIGASQ